MVSADFDSDTLLARLHERQTERDDDATICDNCRAGLTETDRELGFCTQCKSSIESDDEDLNEVERGDYGWDGYSHGD
jgi:hypothetical protein